MTPAYYAGVLLTCITRPTHSRDSPIRNKHVTNTGVARVYTATYTLMCATLLWLERVTHAWGRTDK